MKIQKKWLYILLAAAGVFGVVTILFFSGEKWLRDGWYYIPDRAIAIALRVLADRADSGDIFFAGVEQKEIRRLDEKDYQDTGDRGGGFSVPVFCMELVSLQSWI